MNLSLKKHLGNNSPEIQDFLNHYFFHSENNDGFRYFSSESIKILPQEKEITITLNPDEKNFGVPDFEARTQSDSDFLGLGEEFSNSFLTENNLFNFSEQNPPKEYIPEIGGRIAISTVHLYTDSAGKTYIAVPMTHDKEVYRYSGKLTGGRIIKGSSANIVKPILTSVNPFPDRQKTQLETNKIFELGSKIIKRVNDDFSFGEWNIKFQLPGKSYQQLKGVHIQRAPDGCLEIFRVDNFSSQESLLEHFVAKENVDFKRPVMMIDVDDLISFEKGGDLVVKNIFYENETIDINNLPLDFRKKFSQSENGIVAKNFQMTPPLEMFQKKLQINNCIDFYRESAKELLEKEQAKKWNQNKVGEIAENSFARKLGISKNTTTLHFKISIQENFKEVIQNSNLQDSYKQNLIDFISKKDFANIKNVKISPDFICDTNGKKYLLEHKNSTDSIKKEQLYYFFIAKLFGENTQNINYFQVIGENYKGNLDFGENGKRLGEKEVLKYFGEK